MTRTKSGITSDTVELFPHHFDILKTSSAYSEEIAVSQLIRDLEKPTSALPFKVEENALAAIRKLSENFKCAEQLPETQRPHQGNPFRGLEQ